VAPLRLGGLRGKQSTPSDWLGGTGVVSTVGEQLGAVHGRSRRRHRAQGRPSKRATRQRYDLCFGRIECVMISVLADANGLNG
jgi:hypothetical protein